MCYDFIMDDIPSAGYMICPDCDGEGEFYQDGCDYSGEHMTSQYICERCDGTGEVEIEEK